MSFCTVSVLVARSKYVRKWIDKNTQLLSRICASYGQLGMRFWRWQFLVEQFRLFKIRTYNSTTTIHSLWISLNWCADIHKIIHFSGLFSKIHVSNLFLHLWIGVWGVSILTLTTVYGSRRKIIKKRKRQITNHLFYMSRYEWKRRKTKKIMINVLFIPKYVNIIDHRTY